MFGKNKKPERPFMSKALKNHLGEDYEKLMVQSKAKLDAIDDKKKAEKDRIEANKIKAAKETRKALKEQKRIERKLARKNK